MTSWGQVVWYGASSVALALLLYYPMSRLVWVMSVRRLERKLGHALSDEARQRQRRRARLISGVIAITVALLYNRVLLT